MINNLKECPFCGGKDIAFMDLAGWEAWCRSCGATAGCSNLTTGEANTKEEMIAAWNRRHVEQK